MSHKTTLLAKDVYLNISILTLIENVMTLKHILKIRVDPFQKMPSNAFDILSQIFDLLNSFFAFALFEFVKILNYITK